MSKEDKHIDYQELIASYLSGNATDAEVQQLEAWVMAAPENKEQFVAWKRAWTLSNIKDNQSVIDVNKEWEAIEGQLKGSEKVVQLKPKRSNQWLFRIAAAALVVLAAALWLLWPEGNTPPMIVASESEVKEEAFDDGTQISLNQFSTATYEDDDSGIRRVNLKGDAFFDVRHDKERPFIINTQSIDIEVLGTSFYVDSREELDQIKVIVSSGTVAVRAGEQEIILTKDEMGIYDKNNSQLSKKANDDKNFMAWKNNVLVYNGAGLDQVIYDLNRTFHKKVKLADPALASCTLDATYEQKTLESLLLILESTFNLKAETTGDEITISGTPCNE